ncbi:hypothetical protein EV08_0932 [Prochlorococcus marinus str. SS2]|nr:hypothetical protein EV08_0932 [Prochlorococcus marinus str. SS2]KGG25129.1 hypothetical protein EV09_0023 [Prochlorococcus marinus str. SS35]
MENLASEATKELDKVCGNQLWKNFGFEALDGLKDIDRRAIANYYYGQLQTVRELQEVLS